MRYVLIALLLSGCATATPIHGPDGQKAVLIECDGMVLPLSACYQKAAGVCPSGYTLLGSSVGAQGIIGGTYQASQAITSPIYKNIIVRCK